MKSIDMNYTQAVAIQNAYLTMRSLKKLGLVYLIRKTMSTLVSTAILTTQYNEGGYHALS